MLSDLDVIVKTYPRDWDVLRLYALGDLHIGSPYCDIASIRKKIQRIQDDPFGVVSLCGDLGDYGLRTNKSPTNPYEAPMQPREQQKYIYELLEPIKDKIVSAVPGNHEDRITKEVGTLPLYDLCVLWGIPEVYRDNVAILKLSFGSIYGGKQQISYMGITTHGSTRNKHKKFIAGFSGISFAISGHTHTPEYSPHGRIECDMHHATARHVVYKEVVVDANVAPGGYGIKKEYEISPPPELQYLEFSVFRDPDRKRIVNKLIDYHAIQL